MREPSAIEGARAPLFDRLMESDDNATSKGVLDVKELRASVIRELVNLLNTRSHPPMRAGDVLNSNVLGYGLPDFAHLNAASETDREQLALMLTTKIQEVEARLHQVRVKLTPQPNERRSLVGSVEAVLHVGLVSEPVSFPLVLDVKTGNARLE